MENNWHIARLTISLCLRQGWPHLQGLGAFAFNVYSRDVMHHVRAVSSSAKLLSATGSEASLPEKISEFTFTAFPLFNAAYHDTSLSISGTDPCVNPDRPRLAVVTHRPLSPWRVSQ